MNNMVKFEDLLPSPPDGVALASREGITFMETALRNSFVSEGWEDHFPLTHRFADNVYAREMLIPTGSLIIGKIHRYGHLNVISRGHVAVLTEFGIEELHGPCTFVSKPGTKRVVFAYEDTVWTTFHGTKHTDVTKVEEDIICKTFAEYDMLLQLEDKP